VWRELGGDDRLDVAVLGVQSAKEVEHLAGLGDGLSEITKAISEGLQAGGVVGDGQVALLQGAELGFEVDGTLQLVVTEEALDVVPDGVGGGMWLVDNVEDAFVDRCVEPVDDAVLVLEPLGIAVGGRRRREDMRPETNLLRTELKKHLHWL
jgi:hypothetical protein